MPLKYFDINGHLNFPVYDKDRAEVIGRAREAGVGMITVGTNLETSKKAVEIADITENIWAIVGLHPVHTSESPNDPLETGKDDDRKPLDNFDQDEFRKIAVHEKVLAIGECGLDFFHSDPKDFEIQRQIFVEHIELANEVGKPLMLHVRNGKNGRNAYMEAVDILKKYSKVATNFHFFAGTIADLKIILDIDASVSFTGVITFAREYDELIRYAPLTRVMSETDCPYVSPVPYRGKRNEPAHVTKIVKAIANIRREDENIIQEQLIHNVQKMFFPEI